MELQTKHIVCAFDQLYAQHSAVMLQSLFENNTDSHFTVHIIYEKLKADTIACIKKMIENRFHQVVFYQISTESFKDLPLHSHFTLATYFRILIPQLLPESITKVLYLDVDLLVRSSVLPLFDIDLTDCVVAAAPDAGLLKQSEKEMMQLPPTAIYCNAGVLVMNLDYWRKNNVAQTMLVYLKENPEKILYVDQDVLNVVYHDKIRYLDRHWNVTSLYYDDYTPQQLGVSPELLASMLKNPKIVHFSSGGKYKPWNFGCIHIFRNEYHNYRKKTPWNWAWFMYYKQTKQIVWQVFQKIKSVFNVRFG